MAEIKTEYETLAEAIEKSDEIVIIGGGPVGVEMAGEIVDGYKDKKILKRREYIFRSQRRGLNS